MTGCLCVWWWKGLRARARAQRSRACLAGALAALLLCVAPAPPGVMANPDQQRDDEDDGQSRFEFPRSMDYVKVYFGEDERLEEFRSIVLIEARLLQVVRTEDLGVEFENLDRLDVSGIPLLGSLFDKRLSATDFTAENRVGTAYSNGIGGLVVIFVDSAAATTNDASISVVNRKGRFHLLHDAVAVDTAAIDLGELGKVESVRQLITGVAPAGTTMVLGGLTRSSVPEADGGLPVLGDIPLLQHLFRGTVHKRDETELLVLIKPSVIIQEED